jgi:pimeloyl-ACP methyl ester carboxylesterase
MEFFRFNPPSEKPILHIAHANGFPPLTYRRFFQPLASQTQGLALVTRPFWPGADARDLKDWSLLTEDMLQALKTLGKKVIGVGHSLGAVITLNAALEAPELFSRVILIDPTMLAPHLLREAWLLRKLGLEFRPDLVRGALRRRRHWDSREAALEGFKSKGIFKSWPLDVLKDYAQSMTAPDPQGGVSLTYSPEWEAKIYQTIPTDVWAKAARLQVPALVLRGETSNTFTAPSEAAFRKASPQTVFQVVPGAGHLAPHEKPEQTAAFVLDFLKG